MLAFKISLFGLHSIKNFEDYFFNFHIKNTNLRKKISDLADQSSLKN